MGRCGLSRCGDKAGPPVGGRDATDASEGGTRELTCLDNPPDTSSRAQRQCIRLKVRYSRSICVYARRHKVSSTSVSRVEIKQGVSLIGQTDLAPPLKQRHALGSTRAPLNQSDGLV